MPRPTPPPPPPTYSSYSVFHLAPRKKNAFLRHVVHGPGPCNLSFHKGIGCEAADFNLAKGHPYVIRHITTVIPEGLCQLEIEQGPLVMPVAASTIKGSLDDDPELPQPICSCEGQTKTCDLGKIPDCSGTTIACVPAPPPPPVKPPTGRGRRS